MNTAITRSYLLIIGGIVNWCLLLPSGKKAPHAIVDSITSFGGALLASCFIKRVPHPYAVLCNAHACPEKQPSSTTTLIK